MALSAQVSENVTGILSRFFRDLRDLRPLLEEIQRMLNAAASRSIARAQTIPLKPSTVRRKRYPRYAVATVAKHELVKRQTYRALSVRTDRSRALSGLRKQRGGNATAKPKPNARVLERVGGFIESLTEDDAPFAVRRLEADAVRFGTRLGGLWTQFAATGRLDFAVTDESLEEIEAGLQLAQRDRLLDALGSAGAPSSWEDQVRSA